MTVKLTRRTRLLLIAALCAVSFALVVAGGGCTTGAYATCEERAAKFGVVLECQTTLVYQDGHQVTRCLVSTPQGDKFHYYRSCRDSVRPAETYAP